MISRMDWNLATGMGFVLCVALMMAVPAVADEENAVRAVLLDPGKLAGVDLPDEEAFGAPAD